MNEIDRRFAVAPMMDWTGRHCRAFHRQLTRQAWLYTEMLTADAVIHGDRERLLGFSEPEHPIALQLGGSDPAKLAKAAAIGADWGYDEINLNVGCPSDRVQEGRFGACLMREPQLVADCVAAMAATVRVPVTVKCRIGVDDQEPSEALFALADAVAAAGCRHLVVHARKAWLQGLSPRENRDVPPLDYALVRHLKRERPQLTILLNGGLTSLDQAEREAHGLDGVMLGRAAYQTPRLLLGVDPWLTGAPAPAADPMAAIAAHKPYLAAGLARGTPLHAMTRHLLGLFHGMPGGRHWRRILTVEGVRGGAGLEVVEAAQAAVLKAATVPPQATVNASQ